MRLTWLAAPLLLAAVGLAPAPAPAGVCPAIPNVCVDTESGQLNVFKRGQNAAKLKWRASALDIAIEEIADPTVDAAYGFCIYAGTAEALITDIEVPPGSRWRGNRNGYWYKDTTGSVGGLKGIRILPGSLENAQISVNLRGDALVDAIGFPLADDRFPLLIQLHNLGEGVCWETALEKTTFVKNGLNRKGTLRTTAILRPERCRADQGCAVERPLIGAALCRDRVAAGGGMAKRMKIKMGDITRCRQREAVGKTDGACDPGLCPYSDPACALLDSNLRSGVMRSIGHYQTKLNLACTDISVTAVQEAIPGWGTPCSHARSIDALMECLEMQAWGEYGNLLGDAVFGTQGLLDESLLRCRKELAKQTQKYSSKFNTLLYGCKRSPIVRGRPCPEDPLVTGQTIFDNYVSKLRSSCTDAMVAQLPFGAPCTGADTVTEITDCLGTLARDLAFRGVALSYP